MRFVRLLLLLVAAVCAVGVAAPTASRQPRAVAPGVRVAGVPVGGLTSEPARSLLEQRVARPLRFVAGTETWAAPASQLGADAAVDDAVARALRAPARTDVDLAVDLDLDAVNAYVRRVAQRVAREPRDARLTGVRRGAPVIAPDRPGVAVRRGVLARLIVREMRLTVRDPIVVPVRPVEAAVRRSSFGPVIVISRAGNTLRLFAGSRPVRAFRVATGSPTYPTPAGNWRIVDMQRNPWWRPPASDWAKGKPPIPPGPGNPLGTRWMGLDAAAVGIHGTPDAASIGYSASHGCIRMRVPEAEWLFAHVRPGTPVVIL